MLSAKTKKQLEELDTKISSEDKTEIESLVSKLEEALKQEDYDTMKDLNEKIKNSLMEVGQKVYSQSESTQGDSDDVIETDFSTEK